MALGELQPLAKNMWSLFHGIRRLNLWNFPVAIGTDKPICASDLPGYCPMGWKGINDNLVFLPGFLASRLQLPQRQQQITFLFLSLNLVVVWGKENTLHQRGKIGNYTRSLKNFAPQTFPVVRRLGKFAGAKSTGR